uniref:Tonsoku-like protein n=1 Tax=Dicentrarchus labrax TaxID=13489 RepID=A0A8C4DAA6_DICLA
MSSSREIKQLQKAKSKAQNSNNLKEEGNICNQLGELLSRNGDYEAAIREHQQELALSEVLNDVIGRAVANRKIGECYAEMGNIEAALKHQRCHLDLARSVSDHAEEQRALATIGRTYLFRYESDQSKNSLEQAEDAFRKSLAIVDDRLEGTVSVREISEMKARLFFNLGLVCDHLGEPKRCSEFIRRSVFIADQLLEDLYRANFNLGNIYFRNGQKSNAVRCLEQAKECARKIKDKFSESECFHCIGKVQLSLGDFVAARRSLKKALLLGSQQPLDRQAVKKAFKYADQGFRLEEELGEDQGKRLGSHQAVGLAEQLGDLYCKVGCYSKALDAYQAQLKGAEALGKPARELAVIHVSLAATYTDLRQHSKAVEHYRQELALRQGNSTEECSTWLNIATAQEEGGCAFEDIDSSYSKALHCAQKSGQARLQKRTLRLWLASQKRCGSSDADDTEAKLQELCANEGWSPDCSDGEEEEEEEMDNSEPLDDSDVVLSDSDDDLEGYDKMVSGRRKAVRWNKRNEKGETSLHRACIDGNLKQVQYLVEQGHPVNPRDYCGWTPLHEASNHGHYDVVAVLLEHGANVNDPGGPLCEGVTPLHDALACGNLKVARLLVERGASVTLRNSKGDTARDTLRQWQRTYSRELDQDTKQECIATERLPLHPKPFDALQDSQLFDAENSEPLSSSGGGCPPSQEWPRNNRNSEVKAVPASPKRWQCNGSTQRHKARGTEAAVLYGVKSPLVQTMAAPMPTSMPAPIRMRVRVQEDVFLIPVLEADSCTVSWLCDEAAQRYSQKRGLLPRLSLQKEGALLSPQDLLLTVLHTNEEVLAEVCSWDLPPLPERYKKACDSLAVDENKRVTRLCEVQDGSSSVSVCGLSLAPSSLTPLLRALKLQASLTELRISGNRLSDKLLPELVATTITMPRLRLLDISACHITGEGLEKAVNALKGHSHPAALSHCEMSSLVLSVILYSPLQLSVFPFNSLVSPSRCLPSCPSLVSLNLSGNPSVTSAGLHNILISLREACRPLTLLNLQGMCVSGPWDSAGLDGLSELVQDLRLCSQGLNKLDRQALKQSWDSNRSRGHFIDRDSKCLLSAAASSRGRKFIIH